MSCFLNVGSTGDKVIKLQTELYRLRYYRGKIDGKYGPVTQAAVKAYQTVKHLVIDGCVGDQTWGSLFPAPKPTVIANTIPAELKPFLQSTKNCQSNDPKIIALANQITAGITDTLGKAKAIFNYVRDKYGYSFYYNTKYGAVGMLNQKAGNCTDDAHLIIGLSRAAGIPARYHHVKAQFKDGIFGHTVPELYVAGKWYDADATNNVNVFGSVIWKLVQDLGIFAELPY